MCATNPGWVLGLLCVGVAGPGRAQESLRLSESFPAGYQYHVSARVELGGTLGLPPVKGDDKTRLLPIKGNSAIEYDERVLDAGHAGQVEKTVRVYRRIDFERKVGQEERTSTIRAGVRRMVVMRLNNAEVPFSPDGPLTWSEIDLIRTDVFTPALTGLLPERAVQIGERWNAARAAIQELTDLERIDDGNIECRLEQVTTVSKRRYARIKFTGTVRGINEDGPNRQQLDGYFYFDLESNHLGYLSLKGISSLLDKDGKPQGSVEGRFVLSRQVHQRARELSDDGIKGLPVEPTPQNTLLLYENPDLGLRLLHPRRWRVARARDGQVDMDESNGSGLKLTVEPIARVPTGAAYANETRDYLEKQKAKILHIEPLERVQGLEHFALDAEVAAQRVHLDYYVVRQETGGATLAARLLLNDVQNLKKEVEAIARSVVVGR